MARVLVARVLVARVLVALGMGAVLSACGPSPRRVHYGDLHFERCAAADALGGHPADERRACWAAWLDHWLPGQPPERIAYATARMRALGACDDAPTVPELGLSPAARLPPDEAPADREPPPPPGERVGVCAEACRPAWERCVSLCSAAQRECHTACDTDHVVCARACP